RKRSLELEQKKGELAQLVQSTCLTSRGSLVRTQYSPHYIWKLSSSRAAHSDQKSEAVTGTCAKKGELAQLVQSTCLTSRRSLVRAQYSLPRHRIPMLFVFIHRTK